MELRRDSATEDSTVVVLRASGFAGSRGRVVVDAEVVGVGGRSGRLGAGGFGFTQLFLVFAAELDGGEEVLESVSVGVGFGVGCGLFGALLRLLGAWWRLCADRG